MTAVPLQRQIDAQPLQRFLHIHRMSRACVRSVLLAIVVTSMSAPAFAASDLVGQVTLGGLPVPGASITATQGERHALAVSTLEGNYRLANLADGTWIVQVEMPGFLPSTRELTVPSDVPAKWELVIAPVSLIHQIPAHQSREQASLEGAFTAESMRVTDSGFRRADVTAAPAPTWVAEASVPPVDDAKNRFVAADSLLVNGSVNNGAASPFAQPAAFGNNRSPRPRQWNGAVGVSFGNSAWDARPFSFSTGPAEKPSYTDWQLLGTFGGPLPIRRLARNGTTFFVGLQRTEADTATTHSATMPSELERGGDFSQSRNRLGESTSIIDPVTGVPFPGSVIPASRLSPQAVALLRYYPAPNLGGDRFNYQATVLGISRRTNAQSRFTHVLNARNQLFATWNYQGGKTDTNNIFGFTESTQIAGLQTAITWTHHLTTLLSVRLRYQFTRLSTEVTPFFARRTNVSADAGINGGDQEAENWGPPALLFSSGLAGFAEPQYTLNRDRTHLWSVEETSTLGRHSITFGGEIKRLVYDVHSQRDGRGTFSFTGDFTGSDLADFLLGIPHSSSIGFGRPEKALRGPAYAAYLNDDWRLAPTFTINAGMRWEYEAPLSEKEGTLANLDLAPDFSAAAPVTTENRVGSVTGSRYPESLLRSDVRGVQPRVGFGWRPISGSSTVIRGGYGVYRNNNVYLPIALLMAQGPPLSFSVSTDNTTTTPLSLANGFPMSAGTTLLTFAVDPNIRVSYAHNWQVSIQKDFPASLTAMVSYQGLMGRQLMREMLPNTYPAGVLPPCQACPVGFVYLQSGGRSLRHALQSQLRRRLRSGFSANLQYTLSKATDDAPAFAGPALAGNSIAQDWLSLEGEYGPSNFDQRHMVSAQLAYSTGANIAPGRLLSGWKGQVLRGWTFAGQLEAGSGLPLTPIYLTSVGGTGVTGTIRASVAKPTSAPPNEAYFDPTAFTAPASGQWGSARRNSLRGPAQFSLNAGITRTFTVAEHLNMDWRIEATNILNRVTYAGVNVLVGSPQFGSPNRANAMRTLLSSVTVRFR